MRQSWKKAALTTAKVGALMGGALATWSALAAGGVDAMIPADGDFVDVPGGRLHYVDTGGDGPVLVMLHGLYGQLRNFSYALAAELARDHRLILIDRPGWGHSRVDGAHPPIEAQAQMIADAIDALGLDRPLLVGHSMGGALALAVAVRHPGQIGGLALIAPLTRPMTALPPMFRGKAPPPALRALTAWTVAVPAGTLTGAAVAARVFAPDAVPDDFATRGGGLSGLHPAAFEAGAVELRDANRALAAMVPDYATIALPVAILYGTGDKVLDPVMQGTATAAAIPGATMTTLPGGHMLPVTQPVATAAWLRGLAAG